MFFLNSFSFAFYHCFYDAGKRYGLDPLLLTSIAKVESNFNPRAINLNLNGSVDYGIMQVNSYWLEKYKIPKDWIKEPCYNIHFGAMVLRRCMDIHRGSLALAVDCYNKGSRAKGHGDYVERVFKSYKRYHAMLK
ncbi:MAG: lytic transglycosylase domain-containing protein [Aquificaceae bacterium]|nr:lytic transglycosylase domain-containing protein [Aquificaceae bacterium]